MTETLVQPHPLEQWLANRRSALEAWRKNPPHKFGAAVLLLVSAEFVLSYRLFHGMRLDWDALGSIVRTAIFLTAVEGLVLLITNGVTSLFNKRGRWTTALSEFNVALFPFLVFLPLTFYFWASGGSALLRSLILIVLIAKVLSDWKEVIRVNYRLTGIQTYMLGGVLGGVAYVAVILLLILSGFGVMVDTLSQIGFR